MSGVTFLDVLAANTQSRAPRSGGARASIRCARRCAVVGLALALTSACLPETKTSEGRALHGAPEALERAQSVTLSLEVTSHLERRGSLASLPAMDRGVRFTGVLDPASDRASYASAGKTVAVFDGADAYARRPNALPTDARPWVHVVVDEDLQDRVLDPVALPASLLAYALRPTVLVDTLAGALTGSIEAEGREDVQGTSTSKYSMRVDLTQALAESERSSYSQREQDDLAAFFEILGVEEDALHDGTAWIDDQGAPRRIVLHLKESPAPDTELLVRFDLLLTPAGTPPAVEVPKASAVATVPQLFQYLQPLKTGGAT